MPDLFQKGDGRRHYGDGDGKPRFTLLFWPFLWGMAKVMTLACKKYPGKKKGLEGRGRNWEEHADEWYWCELIDSAFRHMSDWASGEDDDRQSKMNHLLHAGCCIMMTFALQWLGKGRDDRLDMDLRPALRKKGNP